MYLCYNGSIPPPPSSGSLSIGQEEEDRRPYFHFVDFPNLEIAVSKATEESLVKSEELAKKISICRFLMALKVAIDAGKWFDGDTRYVFLVCFQSDGDSNSVRRDDDAESLQSTQSSEINGSESLGGDCVNEEEDEGTQSKLNEAPSVSFLLNNRPGE